MTSSNHMDCPNCHTGDYTVESLIEHLCKECPEKERYVRANATFTAEAWKRVCQPEVSID